MNKILTTHVMYRGKTVLVHDLKENSQLKIEVECEHGRRIVRFSRRNKLCKKCAAAAGVFNTSKPGRKITWGQKISDAKKGVKFSQGHKEAIIAARKNKLAARLSLPENQCQFPTKSSQYKIRTFLMNALRRSLIRNSISDQDKLILDKLNYSVADLHRHLESQFLPGMTWDNYGNGENNWSIDHKKPDSWFQYSSVEDQGFKESFSIENLQPVWHKDNVKKGNRYEGEIKDKVLYFLCGQSGVGKTTVASKLNSFFTVLDKDDFKNIKDLDSILSENWHNDKPVLLQVSVHISSTINRYKNKGYEVTPFFIIEDPEVVIGRIRERGGSKIKNVYSRYIRVKALADKVSSYTCSANDMVQYLVQYGEKKLRNRHDSGVST